MDRDRIGNAFADELRPFVQEVSCAMKTAAASQVTLSKRVEAVLAGAWNGSREHVHTLTKHVVHQN